MVSDAKGSFKAGDVAVPGSCDERIKKTSLLGRIRRRPSAVRDVLASPRHHLPRVGLFQPKGMGDVTIGIVERFSKDVRGPFSRRQRFHEHENTTRQCLASFRS